MKGIIMSGRGQMPKELVELLEGLDEMTGGGDKKRSNSGVTIMPEAQIARLSEVFKDYQVALDDGCKFEAGDIVTPKDGHSSKFVGQPYIVLEVVDKPEPDFGTGDAGSSGHGRRMDMRVMTFTDNDSVAAFWVESWEYEAYEG